MPVYEYYCKDCNQSFETWTRFSDPDKDKCPKCKRKNTKKLISPFGVGGRGDLRESTLHGCHDHDPHFIDEETGSSPCTHREE